MQFKSDGIILIPADDKAKAYIAKRVGKDISMVESGYSVEQFHSVMDYVEWWYENYRANKDQNIGSFREQISFAVDWTEELVLRIPKYTIFRMLEELERAKSNPTAPVHRIIARSWSPASNNREQLNELAKRVSELGERRTKVSLETFLKNYKEYRPA